MPDYKWTPIEPLAVADGAEELAGNLSLYESWRAAQDSLKRYGGNQVDEFKRKLVRRLSIETGILERLYDLDRGTTEALVQKGFVESLVAHNTTDIPPARLIDILRDQEAAIQLAMDVIGKSRQLTKGLMHELHTVLTRHQESTSAVDQFGQRLEIPLLRGKFKEHPNNPRRPDGTTHEYCPPVHVESEIEHLLGMLEAYQDRDPVLVAAWAHHRFTQIHPYQDGNGRLARVLVTMILLQKDLLPIVLDRDIRTDYISSLEAADRGDLSSLIRIFTSIERNAILQALSVNQETEIEQQRLLTDAVIVSLANKFNKRKQVREAELLGVNNLAASLRGVASKFIRGKLESFRDEYNHAITGSFRAMVARLDGGPENEKSHYYRNEVIRMAQRSQQYANFSQNHYFAQSSIKIAGDLFKFVVSFHHVGAILSGIMEATAFATIQSNEENDEGRGESAFIPCSFEPFAFTWKTSLSEIQTLFTTWLDTSLAVGLKEFGDRL
ncbi:MAG TPA: Fic family protein [Terracidiphilus sp.]|jgi:hypothetical protein|nr:Fic family protein [Terracidiphilus sp.]